MDSSHRCFHYNLPMVGFIFTIIPIYSLSTMVQHAGTRLVEYFGCYFVVIMEHIVIVVVLLEDTSPT